MHKEYDQHKMRHHDITCIINNLIQVTEQQTKQRKNMAIIFQNTAKRKANYDPEVATTMLVLVKDGQ